MSEFTNPQKKDQPNTYMVQDRRSQEELHRLIVQDQLMTASMRGVLSEQADPGAFERVLDVGCGPGGWLLQVAQAYPTIPSLIGVDISRTMIEYARTQVAAQHLSGRVEYQVMDALLILEFPDNFFDLVNLRFAGSFMRTWEWPKLLSEFCRVTRPGGVVRITDANNVPESTSPAHIQLFEMLQCAFFRAGNLFEQTGAGLISHFAPLLTQYGCKQVQTRLHHLDYRGGTEAGRAYYEDVALIFRTVRPFIQKWGCAASNYDEIYQQALHDMSLETFHTTGSLLTAWGINTNA